MCYFRRFTPNVELSNVCEAMWKADKNRLTPEVQYQIDPQGKTRYHSTNDSARDPLFAYVDSDVLKRGTYGGIKISSSLWLSIEYIIPRILSVLKYSTLLKLEVWNLERYIVCKWRMLPSS